MEKTLEPLVMQVGTKRFEIVADHLPTQDVIPGDHVGVVQVPPEEEGEVEESPRLGGRGREGNGKLCREGKDHLQGESR